MIKTKSFKKSKMKETNEGELECSLESEHWEQIMLEQWQKKTSRQRLLVIIKKSPTTTFSTLTIISTGTIYYSDLTWKEQQNCPFCSPCNVRLEIANQ